MNKLTGYDEYETLYVRGYHRFSKAYHNLYDDISVMFGIYGINEGTKGEMSVKWEDLGHQHLTAKLCVYRDAMIVLASFNDVFQYIAKKYENKHYSEEQFCKCLDECGFIDLTEYERPLATRKEEMYKKQEEMWQHKQREMKLKKIIK